MDIKPKNMSFSNVKKKKHLFLDISSTNIDTLASSLYHCVETHSIEVFWLFSQPLPHLVGNLQISNVLERISRHSCELLYASNTSLRKQEIFLYEYLFFNESFCPQKTHNETLLFGSILLKHVRQFYYSNQPLNMRMYVCYIDCYVAVVCCYLVIHIENLIRLLRLFTAISDVFTDSPSYIASNDGLI
jgi:hypothetical protein